MGSVAIITFDVQPPGVVDMLDLKLKKVPSDDTDTPHPDPVNHHIDVNQGKIIFPQVALEDSGTYELICNGECSGTFDVTVIPIPCK